MIGISEKIKDEHSFLLYDKCAEAVSFKIFYV